MNEQLAFQYDTAGHLVAPRQRKASAEELAARYAARSDWAASRSQATPATASEEADIHRAGHYGGIHPEDRPYVTDEAFPSRRKRPSASLELDEEALPDDPPRSATGSIRWTTTKPSKRTRALPSPGKQTRVLARRRPYWLLSVVVGLLLVMLLGWQAFTALGMWWQTQQNDWAYGRPRTYQVDAVVGHSDSPQHPSHFIALNLDRQVLVIEFPGGNAAKAQVYLGPTLVGDEQDLVPVTLSFADRQHDGKPDLLIHIGDQVIVLLNTGTKFVFPQQH